MKTGFGIALVRGLIILILTVAGCTGKDKEAAVEVDCFRDFETDYKYFSNDF